MSESAQPRRYAQRDHLKHTAHGVAGLHGAVDLRLGTNQWEPCVALADASPNDDDIVVFFAGKLWGDVWFTPSNPLWYYYAISEVLFTKSNMLERIDKLDGMIMLPSKAYETNGQFNNCIFTNSVIKHGNIWWNHYGAGDSRVAVALAPALVSLTLPMVSPFMRPIEEKVESVGAWP